ncbi:MAG: hypothetical protein AAGF31_10380 [Planctomycetota bacterium]
MQLRSTREILEEKTRDELNLIARGLEISGYRKLSKSALVEELLSAGKCVDKMIRPDWWTRHHNHVYGTTSIVGLILTVAFFVLSKGESNSSVPTQPPVNRVTQTVKQQVSREASDFLSRPEYYIHEQRHEFEDVDDLPSAQNDGFVVLEKKQVWDTRSWRPVVNDAVGPEGSALTLHWQRQIRKASESSVFVSAPKTAGNELICSTDESFPCRFFRLSKPKLVGDVRMIERQIHYDVSSLDRGDEFSLRGVNTYWNSLQRPSDLWVGTIARKGLRHTSDLVLFPIDRPWKKYWATIATNQKNIRIEPEEYEGDNYFFIADDIERRWIYWEVVAPKPGYVYQLRWEW